VRLTLCLDHEHTLVIRVGLFSMDVSLLELRRSIKTKLPFTIPSSHGRQARAKVPLALNLGVALSSSVSHGVLLLCLYPRRWILGVLVPRCSFYEKRHYD
jgi:hypothetical protein